MTPYNTPDNELREALEMIGRPLAYRYPTGVVAKVLGVSRSAVFKRIKLPPDSPSRIQAARMVGRYYVPHTEVLRLLGER